MILVKLGGSILTNKGTHGRPRFNRLLCRRLLKELRRGAGATPLILVHGAGSWGHPAALRYRIGQRRLSGRGLETALTETQASVRDLRTHVLEACRRAHLPAVEVPASSVAYGNGKATYFDAALFAKYASLGLLPVTSGDVILDASLGARILSGDAILELLALELRPARAIFVSNVDGVRRGARTVSRLSAAEALRLYPELERGRDATGGMRGKLAHAARIAQRGVEVTLVNGRIPGRVEAAVRGRAVVGTRLTK